MASRLHQGKFLRGVKGRAYKGGGLISGMKVKIFWPKKSEIKEREETKLAKSVYLLNLGDLYIEVYFTILLCFYLNLTFNFLIFLILKINLNFIKFYLRHFLPITKGFLTIALFLHDTKTTNSNKMGFIKYPRPLLKEH